MKKSWICLLVLTVIMNLVSSIGIADAEIRINEVELNPSGSDSGAEWIELYSSDEINLNNWEIKSSNGRSMLFNASFSGYFAINTSVNLLTNDNNKLSLYNDTLLIFETSSLSDSENNNKTWQYCNGNWNFTFETKNSQNICSAGNSNNNTDNNEEEISLSIDWNEEDIINGEEFDIKVSAENLEDLEYDIRIWIEDDGEIISERYGENNDGNDEWKSGNYYISNFFSDSGDKSDEIKLRIRDSFSDFKGDAKIIVRIRENGKSSVIDETEDDIEILEKEEDKKTEEKESVANITKSTGTTQPTSISTPSISGNVIKLGDAKSIEDLDTGKEGNLIYESKNEKIKLYSFFGFALLCLIFAILIVFKKIK